MRPASIPTHCARVGFRICPSPAPSSNPSRTARSSRAGWAELSGTRPLPFEAFLDVLRAKGYGIGLSEYADMANLLAHWDRVYASELGDAVAALIGRNEDEVAGIRRLFDEMY